MEATMKSLHFCFTIISIIQFLFCSVALAQWEKISGSYGGPTNVVIAYPDSSGGVELFAGTKNGLFHSTDNGATWNAAGTGPESITSIAYNSFGMFASNNANVFRSADRGLSWSVVDSSGYFGKIYSLAGVGAVLYVGSDSGIFISSDNGNNWRKSDTTRATAITARVAPSGDTTVLALGGSVKRSTDNGVTWTIALPGGWVFVPPRSYVNRPLSSLAARDSTILAGSFGKIFQSVDDGDTWSESSPLPGPAGMKLDLLVTLVAVDGSDIYASTGPNLFRSTDRGMAWESASRALPVGEFPNDSLIHMLTPHNKVMFAATEGGVFSSTDHGTSWTARSNGLDASAPFGLAASGQHVFAALGSGYSLARSTDSGSSWTIMNDTISCRFRSLAARGSSVIAGSNIPQSPHWGICRAFRSSDSGASWTADTAAPAASRPRTFAMNDSYIFAGTLYGGSGVARCHKDSSTWTWLPDFSLHGIEGIAVDDSIVIAADDQYRLACSTDSGVNWVLIFDSQDHPEEPLNTIAVDWPTVFAGTLLTPTYDHDHIRHGIWRTTDGGSTWTNVSNGLPDNNITSLVVDGSRVLAATDSSGILLSMNYGGYWHALNKGLPTPYVSSLIVSGEYLYAGAMGGVWRMPLSSATLSVEPKDGKVPTGYALEQNYPNPFNPSTTIRYTVAGVRPLDSFAQNDQSLGVPPYRAGGQTDSKTMIVVYDLLGREGATLVNEKKAPGSYEVIFDGSKLSSGVYFCRMVVGNFVQTRKICLVR
jgi:photosystem II stability/assembly factor-like uncharacterized protein